MLISWMMTQDKRVVTDFWHLNVRITKNNLAYPLVMDTFSVLGNSKCEVLSVVDLKDAFHSLRLSKESKDIAVYYHILKMHHIYISENDYGVEYFTFNLVIIYKCNLRMSTE